jgi:hypothetical protein
MAFTVNSHLHENERERHHTTERTGTEETLTTTPSSISFFTKSAPASVSASSPWHRQSYRACLIKRPLVFTSRYQYGRYSNGKYTILAGIMGAILDLQSLR